MSNLEKILSIKTPYIYFCSNYLSLCFLRFASLLKSQKEKFMWTDEATKAFEALKKALSSTPVLSLPDYEKPFIVESDASNVGIGAVLTQEGKPLAFFSKALGPKDISTYEKELMALVTAVKKWSPYLMHKHFFIKTDHRSLKFLGDQRVHILLQHKWLSKLMGFQYTILFREGKENVVADVLSRMCEDSIPEDKNVLKDDGMLGSNS